MLGMEYGGRVTRICENGGKRDDCQLSDEIKFYTELDFNNNCH